MTRNLQDAGVRFARTYRLAGALATRMLLLSNSVSVLMPGYRKILTTKYGRDNVHLRSHGIFPGSRISRFVQAGQSGTPHFGLWQVGNIQAPGADDRGLPICVRSFARRQIGDRRREPSDARGLRRVGEKKVRSKSENRIYGYVHENELPDLFQSSFRRRLPYSSSTGCSGVAHLACAYGVPIVCADLEDFRQMSDGEGMAIEFYKPSDARDLADCLVRFLTDP